ncbi:MAG: amidophosphoribosyltransferase, partial [Desulfatiglandales bacterium]
ILCGKRVVVIEDSIVRGTTAKNRIKTLKNIGVKEIHMLVSCPPHRYPCYYGIDFTTKGELIAAKMTIEEIRDYIGLDSLGYLSIENLVKCTAIPRENLCLACFDGNYPVEIDPFFKKTCFEE